MNLRLPLLTFLLSTFILFGCEKNETRRDTSPRESTNESRLAPPKRHPHVTVQRMKQVDAPPDYSKTGRESLDSVITKVGRSKSGNADLLLAWIYQQEIITDSDWNKILESIKMLGPELASPILLELALKEISSDRGLKLFKETLDNIGSGERRMSAIKQAALSAKPANFASLLVFLDSNGYKEDSNQAITLLMKSDLVRGGHGASFLNEILKNQELVGKSKILTKLVGEFGKFDAQVQPSLQQQLPPNLAGIPPEAQQAYMAAYYESILSNGAFISDLKSSDVINSTIPENVILKHMASISHLDFVNLGPQIALDQFTPGQSNIGDQYLKSIFKSWLALDSLAASRYIANGQTSSDKIRLLIPEIAAFSRGRGDEKTAQQWEAYGKQ
jgi:hypothetical protein